MEFVPDNHFLDFPEFSQSECGDDHWLKEQVIRNYTDLKSIDDAPLQKFTGTNINSKNYQLGRYFVKTLPNIEKRKASLDFLFVLTELLAKHNIPVASFHLNNEKKFYSEYPKENALYFVQNFRSGSFYQGSEHQLVSAFKLIADLEKVHFKAVALNPYADWDLERVLRTIQKSLDSESSNETKAFAQKVLARGENYLKSNRRLLRLLSEYQGNLNHFDLHPHNILFESDKVSSLLDLESFVQVPYELSRSFAFYKLVRKSLSKNAVNIRRVWELARENKTDPDKDYIEAELLRRASSILDHKYRLNDRSWLSDLPKQVRGFTEIDYIFDNIN